MQKKHTFPLISIITPTLNSANDLPSLIQSVRRQNYPSSRIEMVIADGGSTDKTLEIAKKNKLTIVHNKYVFAEPGIYLGMKKSKGDLLMILASDNIFHDKNAFLKIVKTFSKQDVFAAFPKHDSLPSDTLFTKYINTFTDPINHFIYGHAANARTFKKIYKTTNTNNSFEIYDYASSKTVPILGLAQGFTVRKEFCKIRKNMYDDITPVRDIYLNYKIAYIYSLSLYHHTIRSTEHYFRKQRWFTMMAIKDKRIGIVKRVKYFTLFQWFKFFIFPFYAWSIIFPIIRSIYGFVEDGEPMWFFHPVISFISACAIQYELARILLGLGKDPSRL